MSSGRKRSGTTAFGNEYWSERPGHCSLRDPDATSTQRMTFRNAHINKNGANHFILYELPASATRTYASPILPRIEVARVTSVLGKRTLEESMST